MPCRQPCTHSMQRAPNIENCRNIWKGHSPKPPKMDSPTIKWGDGVDTPQTNRKSGAGDVPWAISSPMTNRVAPTENGQNFNKIGNFSNISSNQEPRASEMDCPPSKSGGGVPSPHNISIACPHTASGRFWGRNALKLATNTTSIQPYTPKYTVVYLRVYGRIPGMGGQVYGRILAVYGRILGVYGRIPPAKTPIYTYLSLGDVLCQLCAF